MGQENQRRHRRLPVKIPLVLRSSNSEEVLLTEDVSFSGVFVRTDAVRPARQLVQVNLVLPTTEEELSTTAGVAHVITPGAALRRISGMGLRFRALDPRARERWDAFIRSCTALQDADPEHGLDVINSFSWLTHVEPIRRRFPRTLVELRIHLRTLDELHELVTRDLSHGGTFVKGAADCPPGTHLKVVIHHPHTDDTLSLAGQVVRAVRSPPQGRGLGIAFDELTPLQRATIGAFMAATAPGADEEILIFDEDEP